MKRLRVAAVFGTRPEAIKMAPLILALRKRREVESTVIVTAQHREMLDQVLQAFRIRPDHDLDLMRPGQSLNEVASRILGTLPSVLEAVGPDVVIVQGDTLTTFVAALSAFHLKIPVAHVEAGLRTMRKDNPFPEEMSRRLTSAMADLHFAPTPWARDNLLAEKIARRDVMVTGNTVIDALFHVLRSTRPPRLPVVDAPGRLLLVTTHRRENFNEPLRDICEAVLGIVRRVPDVRVVVPVHRNPNVDGPVRRILGGRERIALVPPVDYVPFVHLMSRAHLILTDSGGVQEEAPSLGIPVLVARRTTERPEGVRAGVAVLVGTDRRQIERAALGLLLDPARRRRMARRTNPYGDGKASPRIVEALLDRFGRGGRGGRPRGAGR